MNKSSLTNLIALLITVLSFFLPLYNGYLFNIGVFALSGALTNWLAIHMLFEKVPFLYGSGVIQYRFEEIKQSIKGLIMNEFFSEENINQFLAVGFGDSQSLDGTIAEKIDFDKVYDHLVNAIMESQLGGMLAMFGGKEALSPLKDPIKDKMKVVLIEIIAEFNGGKKENNDTDSANGASGIYASIERIIDRRLQNLTPQIIKRIMQDMIKDYLGWLVVWGGVIGGLVGFFVALLPV